jgi:hypothetical protein
MCMTTWEERFAKREVRIPSIIPIETCWRMIGPRGRAVIAKGGFGEK